MQESQRNIWDNLKELPKQKLEQSEQQNNVVLSYNWKYK